MFPLPTTTTAWPLDRRATETITDTNGPIQAVRHYTDMTDNPTWVTRGGASRRYAKLVGGDLSLTIDQSGQTDLSIANPHGDIVTTIDLPAAGAPATSIGGWCRYDEYGNPADSNTALTGEVEYGWLGAHQRAISGAGLVLMGACLYNPASGLLPRFWWFVVILVVATVRVVATVCGRSPGACGRIARWAGIELIAFCQVARAQNRTICQVARREAVEDRQVGLAPGSSDSQLVMEGSIGYQHPDYDSYLHWRNQARALGLAASVEDPHGLS